jgi:hypothetical protein
MEDAHRRHTRGRWYRWNNGHGRHRISIPISRIPGPPAEGHRPRPFDLYSAVSEGILWTLGLALMLVPIAFLFILPHLLIVGRHWR